MNAHIINIGDELLIGQVVNTNASWLGQVLSQEGIIVQRITAIADKREEINAALREAMNSSDLVILSGGLGPTRDDITKEVLCEFFQTPLVFNQEAYAMIEGFFAARNLKVTELNRGQAYLPEACLPLMNNHGTAAGMWFEKDATIVISLPGVPHELKPMVIDHVLPRLRSLVKGDSLVHRTILTHGMGESFLAKRIENWETSLPQGLKLAYLPSPGIVRLRLTARGKDKDEMLKSIERAEMDLLKIIPELVFGYDDDSLEQVSGRLLLKHRATLSTAESCTGGYLAQLITSVPGSSRYFEGGIVAYANAVKTSFLQLDPLLIEKNGAVSEPVVMAMAEGARKYFGSDYAIATSGIAGPSGGTEEKPVGTTWIAVAGQGNTQAKLFYFGQARERNIRLASLSGLNMLRLILG